ncbi:MAG: metal ABC transporter permease [Pseudomonadota bacterium]
MLDLAEFFSDYTFRMVFFGTTLIGFVSGALGSFAYLRKQSLISDVVAHSALPGALMAFLAAVMVLGKDGRNMLGLIIGAVITGTLSALLANAISARTKIPIDTAMAISLTCFFGFGMLLLRMIANGRFPGKGGIDDYLFGNASVITMVDVMTTSVIGFLALSLMLLFWKEFEVRTFDPVHATMLGFRAQLIDTLMFTTIVIAVVIGVKAVGVVLMIAFVVTPPAAARQWTSTLPGMVGLSAVFGAVGSGVGAYLSVSLGSIATGPVIVLTLFVIFLVSLVASPRRSIITTAMRQVKAREALRRELMAEAGDR